MNSQSIFQLLTPLIFLLFSIGFFVIFLNNKHLKAAAYFAISYFCGAIAFSIDFYRLFFDPYIVSYATNTLFLMVPYFFAIGAALKYKQPPNFVTNLTMVVATLGALSYFWFVDNSIVNRTIVMNAGVALIFGTSLIHVFRGGNPNLLDRLLFVLIAVTVVELATRTPILLIFTDSNLTEQNYATSLFALMMHFTSAISSLSVAMILFIGFGIEIMIGLQQRAEIDPLTGLLNRRGFEANAQNTIENARAIGSPVSLLICDIDHFKAVNDTFGHSAGDAAIKQVAKVIKENCRESDVAGRIGGEEFCILLPTATLQMANLVAETIRTNVKSFPIEQVGNKTVTISIGIALLDSDETYETCLQRADEALYAAKRAGRDRVIHHEKPKSTQAKSAA